MHSSLRPRAAALVGALLAGNLLVWLVALAAFAGRPLLLGTALLAYTFGLRHAVDADHISAIDNVTRKLLRDGQRPLGVGLYFSLGHATVVVLLTAAIVLVAGGVRAQLPALAAVGGVVGSLVSAGFLYLIAAINLAVLVEVIRAFRRVRRGGAYTEERLEDFLAQRGMMGRFFGPLVRGVRGSRQMYPIGLLFGLGFDTATEVGLLGIATLESTHGLPIAAIMVFPALFTAGMALVDTADGILMLGAYGWAFVKPIRKLYYNLNVTLISVLVALAVGTIEVLGVIGTELRLSGPFWNAVGRIGDNFGSLGFAIVGLFVATWVVAAIVYHLRGYDRIELRPAVSEVA